MKIAAIARPAITGLPLAALILGGKMDFDAHRFIQSGGQDVL